MDLPSPDRHDGHGSVRPKGSLNRPKKTIHMGSIFDPLGPAGSVVRSQSTLWIEWFDPLPVSRRSGGGAAATTVAPSEPPHDIVRLSDCRSFSNGGLPSTTAAMDRGSSRSPAPSTTAAAARPPSPSPSATSSAPDHPRQHGPALDVRSSRSPAPFATATKKKAASPAPSKKKVAKKKAIPPVPSATLPPPKVPSSSPLFLRPRWSQLSSYFEPPHGLKSISLTLDGLTCIAMWNLF